MKYKTTVVLTYEADDDLWGFSEVIEDFKKDGWSMEKIKAQLLELFMEDWSVMIERGKTTVIVEEIEDENS